MKKLAPELRVLFFAFWQESLDELLNSTSVNPWKKSNKKLQMSTNERQSWHDLKGIEPRGIQAVICAVVADHFLQILLSLFLRVLLRRKDKESDTFAEEDASGVYLLEHRTAWGHWFFFADNYPSDLHPVARSEKVDCVIWQWTGRGRIFPLHEEKHILYRFIDINEHKVSMSLRLFEAISFSNSNDNKIKTLWS